MAKAVAEGPNRSAFIREMFNANKKISYKEVAEAWAKLGNKEPIQPPLFYFVKRTVKGGKTTGRRGRPARTESPVTATTAPAVDSSLLDMEKALDKLIVQATSMSDWKLADALRVARRRVSVALV